METKKKFFKLQPGQESKGYAWAWGFGPLSHDKMPFLSPTELTIKTQFWNVNPGRPPGLLIEGGGKWPDILGHGGGVPHFLVSERVFASMKNHGLPIARATEIPVAQVDSKSLKNKPPPRYFVVETTPGIKLDFEKSGIPTDEMGNPVGGPRITTAWQALGNCLVLKSWSGADLFCEATFGSATSLICTEKVVEIARREHWTNCQFDPIWAF